MSKALYFSEKDIQKRVTEVAHSINRYYADTCQEVVVIGVLNGSFMLVADLVRNLYGTLIIDFVKVSSYKKGIVSNKNPRMQVGVSVPIKDKLVLIVEDIVDTGHTLQKVIKHIKRKHPARINVFTLLNKTSRREVEVLINWVGFDIPNDFVVGYGMDYAGKFRNLGHIRPLLKFRGEAPMKVEQKSSHPFVAGRAPD